MLIAEEYEILRNMQVVDREVFYYLEQRMDRKTGEIGRVVPVSKGGIALDLSERTTPGKRRACWVISSVDVKNSLRRLCDVGLLESLSESGFSQSLVVARVFFVKWLNRDKSEQKQVTPEVTHRSPLDICENTNEISGLHDVNLKTIKQVNPEVTPTIYINTSTTTDAEKPFAMSINWQPSENELRALLFMSVGSKHKIEDIDPRWLGEFVGYWFSMPGRLMTQRQWTAKYAANVIRYFSDHDLVARKFGGGVSGVTVGKQAAFDANARSLPDFARLPRSDEELIGWSKRFGYGDPDPGDGWPEFRSKLKQKINRRLIEQNLPKVSW